MQYQSPSQENAQHKDENAFGVRDELNTDNMSGTVAVLANKARAGDEDSFAQLISLAAPRAFRAAVSILRDAQEAEDAVQEASIVAFRNMSRLRDERTFTSWFLRIVTNKSIDLLRKRKRDQAQIVDLSNLADLRGEVKGVDRETIMDITEAVEDLPVVHRSVIQLYYAAGYTTPEIARMLGKPEGTIRRLLSEAYKMLRAFLGPQWWEKAREK